MINPPLCENCGKTVPTVFSTHGFGDRQIKIALCNPCARDDDIRGDFLERKLTELGPPPPPHSQRKKAVYVIIEVCKDDDDSANQHPIAVFLKKSRAIEFVSSKRSREYLSLDWEIVETGLEDYDL
ncbi:MAG: hypothetical protein WAO00_13910 [Chthoniobacterales bacterium]